MVGTATTAGIGVWGSSVTGQGVRGTSTSATAVYGENQSSGTGVAGVGALSGVRGTHKTNGNFGHLGNSQSGVQGWAENHIGGDFKSGTAIGLRATSSGVGLAGVALEALANDPAGVAIYGLNTSTDTTIVGTNKGTGRLMKLYTGATGGELRFVVENNGNIKADGTYSSPASDFAELLPGREGLDPGDVLAIDVEGKLMKTVEAYQASVIGVYSTKPGFLGGSAVEDPDAGLVPLAMVGVVPVKASAENGPIRPGDMLVASSTPGHAMRAGARLEVGRVIGKALGRLDSGTGMVTMAVILH